MNDETSVSLGPGHIQAKRGSAAAAKEINAKAERLVAEWEAWKATAGPSGERDASA
jgi:hypothetical protein